METVVGTMLGGREMAWREFLRRMSNGQAEKAGYGSRIEFPEAGGAGAGGLGRSEPLRDGDVCSGGDEMTECMNKNEIRG